MRTTQPPRIATCLLRHFGSSPSNDAVMGDLDEHYRHGRSRLWYWRQIVSAIVLSFFAEVWNRKLLAIRALLIGWTVKACDGQRNSAEHQPATA